MNTDSFFASGQLHPVCQDYALAMAGTVILSDGCSSSPHTDFGSRILCRMAYQHGREEVIAHSRPLLDALGLPLEALDATLLTAEFNFELNSVCATVHGDGVVVGRRRDGTWLVVEISYPSGAPFYPSYEIGPIRKLRYKAEFGTIRLETTWDPEPTVETTDLYNEGDWEDPAYKIVFPKEIFDLVLIFSDGVQSFRSPTNVPGLFESVPLQEVLEDLLKFKGFAGEFVTRRAKRFLKDVAAKGWHHDDDFSIAGIYLGDL